MYHVMVGINNKKKREQRVERKLPIVPNVTKKNY